MRYWLAKSEPEAYSIDDLECEQEGVWDGIRNYQVRNLIRDDIRVGDQIIFYHSNAGSYTGAVGVMAVEGAAVPDQLQFDPTSAYFDPKADASNPRWLSLPVMFVEKFSSPVYLAAMRRDPKLAGMQILARGNRLSITALTKDEFVHLVRLGRGNLA